MPVHRGKDKNGSYYQWGHQKKYYYTPKDPVSRKEAKAKAHRQGGVVKVSRLN